MIQKTKLRQNLFDFVFAFWVIYYFLFKLSTFGRLFANTTLVDRVAAGIGYIGLGIVLVLTYFRKKDFVIAFLLILFGAINAYYIKDYTAPMLFLFLCAAKSIDITVTEKKIFTIVFITFVFVVAFSLLGLIQNKSSTGLRVWDNRTYLGFVHPNYCGAVILNLILLLIFNKRGELLFRDYFFILCLEFVNFLGPKSKTSLILGAIAAVTILFISKVSKNKQKKILSKFKYLPLILVGFSILVIYLYYNNMEMSLTLNLLLSTRIEQMAYFWNHYRITLLGQVLENVSSSQANMMMKMRALDNSYLYMLLGKGIVFTVVYILLAVRSSIYYLRSNDNAGTVVLIMILIWGLTETAVFRIEMVYLLLLLSKGIYESGGSDEIMGQNMVNNRRRLRIIVR